MTSQQPIRAVPAEVPEGLEDVYLEFLVEASEILSRMDTEVVELEKGTAGPELLEAVFRGMHTLKGAAGFLNLASVQEVAHRAEDSLSRMRTDGTHPALLVTVLECLDELRELLVGGASRTSSPSVRVNGATMDRLLELSGEMASRRQDIARLLAASGRGIDDPVNGMAATVEEVHRTVLRARVQPVDEAFGRLPRVVRDASVQLGKKVELIVRGREVEIDRGLLDPLSDVLVHLLRNAVDHGVETPDSRRAAGKPEVASVVVHAYRSTDGVVIDVSDDGRGIDVERVRAVAVERGLLDPGRAQGLTESETAELLFLPGFSTAGSVGMLSGRGVGMDVVRTAVEEHGGSVTLESSKGLGTTISVRLPSTLLGMPVVVFTVNSYRCMLPRGVVEKIVAPDELLTIGKELAYRQGSVLVPVVDLAAVFSSGRSRGPGLLCRIGKGLVVFQVSSLTGSTETLVRPVDRLLRAQGIYTGMSLTENALPALLLDPAGLIRRCGVTLSSSTDDQAEPLPAPSSAATTTRALLVSTGSALYAIPERAVLGVLREPALAAVAARPGIFVLGDEVLIVRGPDGFPTAAPRCLVRLADTRHALAVERIIGLIDIVDVRPAAGVAVAMTAHGVAEILEPESLYAGELGQEVVR